MEIIKKECLIKLHKRVIAVLILILIYSFTDPSLINLRILTIISLFTNYIFMKITEINMIKIENREE